MSKKMLPLLLIPVIALFFLAACGKEVTASKSVNDIYTEITQKVSLPDMLDLNPTDLANYTGIESELYSEGTAHIPVSATLGDMILIFKAKDAASLETLRSEIDAYRSQKLDEMNNYIPAEYDKIKASEISSKGLYIWLVVSDDAETILGVINDNIK
jgi:hypothetical protein